MMGFKTLLFVMFLKTIGVSHGSGVGVADRLRLILLSTKCRTFFKIYLFATFSADTDNPTIYSNKSTWK